MEAFLIALLLVAVAEIGDKSLFLTILLMLRHRRPLPILGGLVIGIVSNLALAAAAGSLLADWLDARVLAWIVGAAFLAMAVWSLIPEKEGLEEPMSSRSLLLTAALSYFMLEMADKTQLATLALAARFDAFLPVLAGGVLGVVLVNAPAIWLGHKYAARLPMRAIRWVCALLSLSLAAWILGEAAGLIG